jgi:hypothetical protein
MLKTKATPARQRPRSKEGTAQERPQVLQPPDAVASLDVHDVHVCQSSAADGQSLHPVDCVELLDDGGGRPRLKQRLKQAAIVSHSTSYEIFTVISRQRTASAGNGKVIVPASLQTVTSYSSVRRDRLRVRVISAGGADEVAAGSSTFGGSATMSGGGGLKSLPSRHATDATTSCTSPPLSSSMVDSTVCTAVVCGVDAL